MSSLPQDFIFRFSFPCREYQEIPKKLSAEFLKEEYRFPYWNHRKLTSKFSEGETKSKKKELNAKEKSPFFFDFRMAWHLKGLFLTVVLSGKKTPLFCDRSKLELSDSLQLCLDMRDVRDVHRGSRFCHKLLFLPNASSSKQISPTAYWLPIHRAKAHPNPVDVSRFLLASNVTANGYQLSVYIPGETLTGYDPKEHSRLGFHFSLLDNELGNFNLQHSNLLPVDEDPSLWSVLELV